MTSRPATARQSLPVSRPESPAAERSRGKALLVRIATDRPLLLIVLIVALIAVMTILEPTTFPRPANAAVVLLDTAQTGILACGMMVLMISGMFDLSIGGILAFSGIMAGLAVKQLGLAAHARRSWSAADGACCSASSTACWSPGSRSTR